MHDTKRFVPSARGQIISRRTYQRPLDENGTKFETWPQVIARVIKHQQWLWESAKKAALTEAEMRELDDLHELLLDRKVAVAGRTFWLGGTDIAKEVAISNFNCFSRNTSFVTADGVKTFDQFEHGDTCRVMAVSGTYEPAVVKSYGVQQLNTVTLSRGSTTREYQATADHRWLLADGSETTALKVGDVLASPKYTFWDWDWDDAPVDEQLWWCYGFVYGDGAKINKGTGSMVRLCGAKNRYLPRFTNMGFGHSFPPSCNEDAMVYTGKYTKTLPASGDDIRLIRAFLWGWLNADGGKSSGGRHTPYDSLQCSDAAGIEFFRKHAPTCGLFISSERDVTNRRNSYVSDKTAIKFQLLSAESPHYNSRWHVKSIVPSQAETVWCLEVENQHNFVLSAGVVTGNCAAINASKIHDMVDIFWGLLNGAGEGSRPVPGTLTGFRRYIENVTMIPSTRDKNDKGPEHNEERFDPETGVWTIVIGDSARAWAKSLGKLLAGKYPATSLVLDFRNIRGAGQRLRNYGWISQGDVGLRKAYKAIVDILNDRADQLLTHMNILDIVNHLGTVLSTRRAAEILVYDYGADGWEQFARAKNGIFSDDEVTGLEHRGQSNNSLMFRTKPSIEELTAIMYAMDKGGKGEPGIINAETMKRRAPWADLLNPCAEILLSATGGVCNLVTIPLNRYIGDTPGLHRAARLIARANYRQTCVSFDDGILQESWDLNNDHLHLMGVSLMGVVQRPDMTAYDYTRLRRTVTVAAYAMADELGLPHPKNITTMKPEGTISKCYDATEGMHRPLGKYIFNNVGFSIHDPMVDTLKQAGYRVFNHPYDESAKLVTLPVSYDNVDFGASNGKEVDTESAIDQLERYKMLMQSWCDQNVSCTISYDTSELPDIIDWLYANWDNYVAVSFLKRNDVTKTAADLGYPYLPQEIVDADTYHEYVARLKPVNFDAGSSSSVEYELESDCAGGACPVR